MRARHRVRTFLRRTIEGCQRIAQLDRDYDLRASVQQGATVGAISDDDMAALPASYAFLEAANFRSLMPAEKRRHSPFFHVHSEDELRELCGAAEGIYVGGITDLFGGSFHPRRLLHGLARALAEKGVRFFQETEALATDFSDHRV